MIDSYNSMPLGIYQKLVEVAKDKSLDPDEQKTAIVSVLSGKSVEELERMLFAEFRTYADKAGFVLEQPKPSRLKKTYKVGEFTCRLERSAKSLTWGQLKDFKELVKHYNEHPEWVLSVVLVPVGKEYCEGYKAEELHKAIIDHLPITDVQAITAFFLQTLVRSTKSSLIYLGLTMRLESARTKDRKEKKMLKMMAEAMREAIRSLQSGVGSTTQITSLGLPILLGMPSTDGLVSKR